MFQTAVVASPDKLVGHSEFLQLVQLLNRHVNRGCIEIGREGYKVSNQDDPSYETIDAYGRSYSEVQDALQDASNEVAESDLILCRGGK